MDRATFDVALATTNELIDRYEMERLQPRTAEANRLRNELGWRCYQAREVGDQIVRGGYRYHLDAMSELCRSQWTRKVRKNPGKQPRGPRFVAIACEPFRFESGIEFLELIAS